jgi:hypothetical protein
MAGVPAWYTLSGSRGSSARARSVPGIEKDDAAFPAVVSALSSSRSPGRAAVGYSSRQVRWSSRAMLA